MTALTPETVDIIDPDLFVARGYPHEEWAQLRREAPIYWYERPEVDPFWVVTRYADIVNVSRQPQLFKSIQRLFMARNEPDAPDPNEGILHQLLNMNPPEHGAYRGVVNRRFTPRGVKTLRQEIVRSLGPTRVKGLGEPVNVYEAEADCVPSMTPRNISTISTRP